MKPPLPSRTSVASQTMNAPRVSSHVGLKFVSPPSSRNLSVPPLGQRPEWMKRSSWLFPVSRTTGFMTEPPSSGRAEMRMIGWHEPRMIPGWISRR